MTVGIAASELGQGIGHGASVGVQVASRLVDASIVRTGLTWGN